MQDGREAADPILRGMAFHLSHRTDDELFLQASESTALAARGAPREAGIHHDQVCIAYEGDIFWRDDELKSIAARQGTASAIATAYQTHGRKCLERIHGPFSLAIHDPAKDLALLAIDRAGIHRICFQRVDDLLLFGGTTASIAAHPRAKADIDPQAIFDYLYFHMVPSPRGIFQHMEKLLPGQYLVMQQGKIEKDFYWRLRFDESDAPFDELSGKFHHLLQSTVSRAAKHGEVGAFLSGGTDSSTMAGMLAKVSDKPARTFSIGFEAEGFDETEFAAISARHFGAEHVSHYIKPQDVTDAIPRIARDYDEPFGNASAVPTYLCAKLAREHGITNLIAGDGGDEIFAGNTRYLKQQVFEYYWHIPAALRAKLIEPLALNMPGMSLPGLRKLQSYVAQARVPLPDRLESYNFLNRTPLDEIFSADFLADVDTHEPLALLREVYQHSDSGLQLNGMLHLDMKFTLADNDLRKVSSMCALAGVKALYPLLDDDMVDFSGLVPAKLKIHGGKLRWFFKQSLKDFLAPETLTKSKHGFGLPFGLWLNSHPSLHELAQDSLRTFAGRGFIHPAYIDRLWKQHGSGHASYYGVMIWVIMMLEQWLSAYRYGK